MRQLSMLPLVAAYMDPAMLIDTTPQTEDTKTMLPIDEAFNRGWASCLK